jgi:hypothetical protein
MGFIDLSFLILSSILTFCYLSSSIIFIRASIIFVEIGYFFLALDTGLDKPGMTAILITAVINSVINCYKIIQYYYENSTRCLPKELHTLYSTEFELLTPKEFKLLHQYSKREEKTGALINANEAFQKLMFVLEGAPIIRLEKGKTIRLSMSDASTSIWLGEMSFLKGGLISADVFTEPNETVRLLSWTKQTIDKLQKKHPTIIEKLRYIIANNLVEKVRFSNTLLENSFT